jgi:hypothetical protein
VVGQGLLFGCIKKRRIAGLPKSRKNLISYPKSSIQKLKNYTANRKKFVRKESIKRKQETP